MSLIPTKIWNFVQDQIYTHLATICKLSFSAGMLPTILKIAKVIPIHKKDSKLGFSDYGCISVIQYWPEFWETNAQKTYWISWGKINLQLQTIWFPKRCLNKQCNFKSARKHPESTKWQINCMWDLYWPWAFDTE